MLGVLLAIFTHVLEQFRSLQVVKICRKKSRVVLLFATKSVHVASFTDQRANFFSASDITPVHGVSPA